MRSPEYKSQLQGVFLLFFISPFITLIQAIRNFRTPYAKNVVWFFTIFYGFTFVISNAEMDANRYAEKLVFMNHHVDDYEGFFTSVFSEDSNFVDFLLPIVTYLVSIFTDESKFLFAVFALIFGYFFSRNVWFLIERSPGTIKNYSLIILIVFVFIAGIWKITNFRWWTALHIFIYGLLPYLYYKKYKYLLFCLLSCFVHFSFIIPVIILPIYILLGNRLHIYFIFFAVSLFISQLELQTVRTQLEFLPDLFQERARGYTDDDYLENRLEAAGNMNWYAQLYVNAMNFSLVVLLFLIYIKHRDHVRVNAAIFRVFCFTLLLYGVTNIVSSIPSVWRFMSLSQMIACAAIFLVFQTNKYSIPYRRVVFLLTPLFLLFLIVTLRIAFETFGLNTIMGNVITALVMYEDYALIQLIK